LGMCVIMEVLLMCVSNFDCRSALLFRRTDGGMRTPASQNTDTASYFYGRGELDVGLD